MWQRYFKSTYFSELFLLSSGMHNFPIAFFNSNNGSSILAFGEGERCCPSENHLEVLDLFLKKQKDQFIIGYLSYDIKNQVEKLQSNNPDYAEFPELFFWVPQYVVKIQNEHFEFIQGEHNHESFEFLNYFLEEETDMNFHEYIFPFQERTSKEQYIENVKKIKEHIQRGDVYEMNYCQEFFAQNVELNYPLDAYFKLNQITKAPFSSFLTFDDYTAFCGSPERFLQKGATKLISQPIKGTAPRGKDLAEDLQLKEELSNDPKERSENVMIVDLVRNDLSKIAKKNSVTVDELFGVYSFETVHQLVSTVSCEVEQKTSFVDIIKATFPMGSMTGAPKHRAMQLIEEYEDFKRGLYSGSIGYITPHGDFDFNVVIRTLLYNKKKKYLSCAVGGAITINSDPEKEFQECLVKVGRILDGMNG